jgi:hypothetical protein
MNSKASIADWARMHASLGYNSKGVRDESLIEEALRIAARKKRREEKIADTGL